MKRFSHRAIPRILVCTAAAFITGCFDGQSPSETPKGYKPTEPKFVLANVEVSFGQGDVQALEGALGDDFTFYFDAEDTGRTVNGYVIPEKWDKEQLLQAARHMLERTHSVALSNSWRTVGTPSEGETAYFVAAVPLSLLVMIDAANGYLVRGARCNYEFEKQVEAWRLHSWRDVSSACGGCISVTTLGEIWARYYL